MIVARYKNRSLLLSWGSALLALVLLFGCQGQQETESQWVAPALEDEGSELPSGRDVVQRMVDFMTGQEVLVMEALVTYQALQDSGQKLHFDLLQRMAVKKPDKLFWKTLSDDATVTTARFSDGRFTMHKHPSNIWGELEGPKAVSEMISRLVDEYGIAVPFRDLLAQDLNELWLSEETTSLFYVGEAFIDGVWTEHVAARKPAVDFELWVRKGAEPFPAKMAVVYTEEEGQPSYSARFRKWTTTVSDTSIFDFKPPEGAERIEVVPVVLEGVSYESN